jgi:predicted GNAT family acetyltransferase
MCPTRSAGRSSATGLLGALLDDARSKGFTIVPLCPFVAGRAQRHPEWAPLFTR